MTYNLNELRAFLAVVETGSLGRAAEAMHLTQPALSRIVKRLEIAVGEPLFERHSGGMRLTPYGKALAPHAQVLCNEERMARDEMDRMRGLAKGVLRIGATAGASASLVPKAIGAYIEKWPGIAIEVTEGIWEELEQALENYQLDLIVGPEAPGTERIVVGRCKWSEKMSVIVGANHPLLHKNAVHMADLLQERWCFVPRHTEPHTRLMSLYSKQNVTPPAIAVCSSSIPLLKSLVAHSGFISWLTRPMYESELHAGIVEELSVEGLDHVRMFSTYHRRAGILPKPALRFLDEVIRLI